MDYWVTNLDDKCVRIVRYYGVIVGVAAIGVIMMPVFGAHSLLSKPYQVRVL
jgi:hypothetical protein